MIYVNTEEVRVNGQVAEKAQEKKLLWDEENRLRAIDINGYVSNYTYDAGGERVTKLSGGGQGIFVNSVFSGGKTSTSDFTLYVNPYLVAQNGGRYTKHIYIGSQRIVSKIGDFDSYGADPRRVEKAGESFSGVKVNYDAKYKKALEVVKASYDTFEVPYYGTDNNDYVNGLGFCCNPSGDTGTSGSPTAKMAKNDNVELQQFYYHPDHLGSSSYISNLDGEVVQHIEYVPFGEVFLEEKNAKWNTPYLFTSKELDRETGMYYFGARYQDPKLGIFISVDPLADKFKGVSSYAYALNNPVRFIDPTGMSAEDIDPPTWKAAAGEVYWDPSDNKVYQSNADGSWTQSTELKEVSIRGYERPSYFENYNKGYYDTYKHIDGENPYSPYTPDGYAITVYGSIDWNFTTYSASNSLVLDGNTNQLAGFGTLGTGVSTTLGFDWNFGVSFEIMDKYDAPSTKNSQSLFDRIEGYSLGGGATFKNWGVTHSKSAFFDPITNQFIPNEKSGVISTGGAI
ncbi:RHS repeat-associated core domain-containing protein [Flavobacterium sp. LHD-85]|uniref:RHS repeat domain-containing protein n=1 Tax=Flavobacterium sp. LHD-85 TaxID=3071410 RepID=UPI0027E1AFF6|nr:RHS repeat-associated core domain-containing protein [Flavobacterium sp. LHD-85]MDQ6528087.1 RHS repeat-associated core domain-containing protein [Flavobacterium sp. LHD-85]